jgi:multicomponent K+:H+ antiporter subunit A
VSRVRDAFVAVGLGGLMTALILVTTPQPLLSPLAAFFAEASLPQAFGRNVVNVILVDFRGFDTLGEITVLAVAALGIHALLDGLKLTPHAGRAATEADRHPIMLAMLMRPLLPLALTVAVYIFLRGHNLPGGGFIAGLIAAVALMLQYIASGIDYAAARLRIDYVRVLGLGLLIATVTGLASLAIGKPFLTSAFGYVHPPVIEKFELASAMAFDLGVFLVVIASVMIALYELGMLSRRESAANPSDRTEGQA